MLSMVGGPAIAVVGVGAAGAAPVGSSPAAISPAGSYTATIISSVSTFPSPLTLTRGGSFVFTGGPQGTWTETGDVIHMTGTLSGHTYVFSIRQFGKNLGSTTKRGTITLDGAKFARWYGVRL
jgi:hypothetical protein